MTEEPPRRTVQHTDSIVPGHSDTDRHYETSEQYSTDLQISDDEDTQTTARATRGEDTTLRHPVDDPDELDNRAHLTAQLAKENRDDHADEATAEQFNNAILDFAEYACSAAEIDVSAAPVRESYVKAFLIGCVWQLDSVPALCRHLTDHPDTLERIGFDSVPSQTSFYRRRNEVSEGWLANVEEASKRAVHAAWRRGVPVPDDIHREWDLHRTPVVSQYPITPDTKREALRNWVRLLLGLAVEDLSFYRASNKSYGIAQYIGMFAHSALQSIGITRGSRTAAWLYGPDNIPSGTAPIEQIKSRDLDLSVVEEQFASAHTSVLQLCADCGLFDNPLDLAFDTTDVTWWGEDSEDTVGKRRPQKDATPDWVFGVLTAITKDARVCFGVKHVRSKDQHAAVLKDLLTTATANAQINHILADKEFYDGSVIDVCRKYAGQKWILKAPNRASVRDFIRPLPKDEPGFHDNIDATSATPNPNAFAIPDELTGQQKLVDFMNADVRQDPDGRVSTHTVYLTDMDDEEATAEHINFLYDDRWSIETAIRQFKLDFHPVCESGNRKLRIYFANIAVLFFNWHALINRALSPRYNLPLDVSHHELLTAIRDVAFTEEIECEK